MNTVQLKSATQGKFQLKCFITSQVVAIAKNLKGLFLKITVEIIRWSQEMITAIDKGIKAAELSRPPAGVYGDVDLRVLPKYISYRASLLKENLGYQYLVLLLAMLWISTAFLQWNRIDYWQEKYREKEFILVPSKIVGHTPAVPQTVPDSYVRDAINSLIWLLGNTTPSDVDERHERFASFMSSDLKSKFLSETARWRETVRTQGIYEQVEITRREFLPDEAGGFDVVVDLRRDRRMNGDFIGTTQEILKMKLQLIPPQDEKEWIFEIREFSRRPQSNNKMEN